MKRMVLIPEERLLQYERRDNEENRSRRDDESHQDHESHHVEVVPERPSDHTELTDDIVVRGIPKPMRTRAKALLERLKARPEVVSWDNTGQVKINGDLIPKSNISDLISDAMRFRKHFKPEGSREFFCLLNEINVPRDLVRNEERRSEAERLGKVPNRPTRRVSFSRDSKDVRTVGNGWVFY